MIRLYPPHQNGNFGLCRIEDMGHRLVFRSCAPYEHEYISTKVRQLNNLKHQTPTSKVYGRYNGNLPFRHRSYFLTVAPTQIWLRYHRLKGVWLISDVLSQLRDWHSSHITSNGVRTRPSKIFAPTPVTLLYTPCQSPSTTSARNGCGATHRVRNRSKTLKLTVSCAWLWTLAMSTSANFTRFTPWSTTYTVLLLLSHIDSRIGHLAWNPLPVSILWCSVGPGQENQVSRGLQRVLESTTHCAGAHEQLGPRDGQPKRRGTHGSKEDWSERAFNTRNNKRWRVILQQMTTSMCRWYCIRRWR